MLRAAIRRIPGLDVLDERVVGRFGVAAIDPLRVCVDVRATGLSGYEVARRMRRDGDLHVELCGEHVVVAVFGLGEDGRGVTAPPRRGSRAGVRRAPGGARTDGRTSVFPSADGGRPTFDALAGSWRRRGASSRCRRARPSWRRPSRWRSPHAEGRIAAECLAAYPPGIPNVLPGERLTAANLATLQRTLAHGGVVRGAADPTLRTVLVVAEPAALEEAGGAAPSPRARGGLMLALALALGASVAWGGSDFVAGLASRRMPLLAVLVGSQVAGLVLLLGLLAVTGEAPPPGGAVLAAALAGLAELVGFAALYKGLAMGPMSVVAPISSPPRSCRSPRRCSPARARPTAAAVGMGLVLLGAALACAEPDSGAARRRGGIVPGAALAALAALCFGAFFVGMDSAAHEAGAVWAVALNRSTSVSVLVFAVALMRPRVGVGRTDLAAVAAVGLLDAAANAMFAFALTQGLMSTVSVLGSLYPVTTVVLAVMVLDERVAPRQAAGVAIVLAGIGLVSAHV